SRIIPSASKEITSPETEPFTSSAISRKRLWKFTPDSFATNDGLVVTPERIPQEYASLISTKFAVSIKNFIIIASDLHLIIKTHLAQFVNEMSYDEKHVFSKKSTLILCTFLLWIH